jgi:Lysozyme like domain
VARVRGEYASIVGGDTRFAGVDQGIDFTGAGPVYALDEGVITRRVDAGSGWPGLGALLSYKLTSGPGKNRFVYIAEDFIAKAGLKVGSVIKRGEVLGRATGSGLAPGIETGWADAGGHAIAHAPDSGPTAAGRDFQAFVSGGGRRTGRYSFRQLEALWVRNGGPRAVAPIAAAIALAESGGDPNKPDNSNSNGSVDRGLWRINSVHADLFGPQLSIPDDNARAAVTLFKRNGGFQDWVTYKNGDFIGHLPPPFNKLIGDDAQGHLYAWDKINGKWVLKQNQHVIGVPVVPFPTEPIVGEGAAGEGAAAEGEGAGASGRTRPGGGTVVTTGGGAAGAGGLLGLGEAAAFFGAALWLLDRNTWLRIVEFVTGSVMMLVGVIGLAVTLLARTDTAQAVAESTRVLPGPAGVAARGVALAGRPKRAIRRETREYARARTTPSPEQRRAEIRARARQRELDRQAAEDERRKVRARATDRRLRVVNDKYDEVPF